MSNDVPMRKISDNERLALERLEPAFPPVGPGVRAVAYGHALSDAHIDLKNQVQKCLKR